MNNIVGLEQQPQDIFEPEEFAILATPRSSSPTYDKYYEDYSECLLDKLKLSPREYKVSVGETGTDLINAVFDANVDDNTLVVTSTRDHDAVKLRALKCKNLLILSSQDLTRMNVDKVLNEAEKYRKVFIAIIGTSMTTGEVTPNKFFSKLKYELIRNGIKHKIMIDDAQSMILIPRNYTYFDYIVSTAHVYIKDFNMGILISKIDEPDIGIKASNWLDEYLDRIDVMIPAIETYTRQFGTLMQEEFSELFAHDEVFDQVVRSAPHFFTIRVKNLRLDKDRAKELKTRYNIAIEYASDTESYIRFRLADIIQTKSINQGVKELVSMLSDSLKLTYTNLKEIK